MAALYAPFLRGVLHTAPLSMEQWAMILLVGVTVVAGGELDKFINRRLRSPLG